MALVQMKQSRKLTVFLKANLEVLTQGGNLLIMARCKIAKMIDEL